MKAYWKWILGILIALAVIAAIPLGMHYLINNGYIAAPAMYAWHYRPSGPAFDKPYDFDGWDNPRGFEGNRGWGQRGPWDHHGWYFGFFGPFAFLGGLIKLSVFFGLLYGAYWLGRRNARIALDPPPASGRGAAPNSAKKRGRNAAKG